MKIHLFLLGIALVFLFDSCKQEVEKKEFIRPVKLADVSSLDVIEKSYPAVVTADEFSNLAFKMSGPLVSMPVEEGQQVKKGMIVAEIDQSDYSLDLQAKKASYQNALSQMNRAERLLKKNAISIQEYEMSKATYTNAYSAYECAKSVLEDTKLRAPFDGFIQKRYVENYQRVQPGQEIMCLVNPDKIQIKFTIPETNVVYFASKHSVFVEFDTYKGELFKAKLKEYVQASPDGSGIPVYLTIDDPNFNLEKYKVSVGFSCRVIVVVENTDTMSGVAVPLSAIVYDDVNNCKTVFVYDDAEKVVRRRKVEDKGFIIKRDEVIVEGNLSCGERVVSAGGTMLVDGQKVKILTD